MIHRVYINDINDINRTVPILDIDNEKQIAQIPVGYLQILDKLMFLTPLLTKGEAQSARHGIAALFRVSAEDDTAYYSMLYALKDVRWTKNGYVPSADGENYGPEQPLMAAIKWQSGYKMVPTLYTIQRMNGASVLERDKDEKKKQNENSNDNHNHNHNDNCNNNDNGHQDQHVKHSAAKPKPKPRSNVRGHQKQHHTDNRNNNHNRNRNNKQDIDEDEDDTKMEEPASTKPTPPRIRVLCQESNINMAALLVDYPW